MLGVSLATLCVAMASQRPAFAQEAAYDFNIPRGGLGSVLNAIAAAGKQPISFQSNLAKGLKAGPITGHKSVKAALSEALAGTGLVLSDSGGALTIVPANQRQLGVNANSSTDVLDIDVVGTKTSDQGFVAGDTASSSRIAAPLQQTPLSITGVTKDVLTTQATTSAVDAAANVSGVTVAPAGAGGSINSNYAMRGMVMSGILVQGQQTSLMGSIIPIQDVERVDVIKGPSSILTGVGAVGGAINLITKQPTSTPVREVTTTVGDLGFTSLGVDLGGPLQQFEGTTYRLNMSGSIADENFGHFKAPHELLFSPSVRWENATTTLEAGLRFVQTKVDPSPFTFFGSSNLSSSPYPMPRNGLLGSADAHMDLNTFQPYFSAQHVLGTMDLGAMGTTEFTVHSRTQYSDTNFFGSAYQPAVIMTGSQALVLGGSAQTVHENLITNAEDLTIKHDLNYLQQTMRFGFDDRYTDRSSTGTYQYGSPSIFGSYAPGSNFPYSMANAPYVTISKPVVPNTLLQNDVGLSFQDNITLFDRFHFLGAVRQDYFHGSQSTWTSTVKRVNNQPVTVNTTTLTSQQQIATSYQIGAAYDVMPWMTVYASKSVGFQPTTVLLANGGTSPPTFRNNIEAGAKFSFFDKRLNLTTAVYELKLENSIYSINNLNYVGPGYVSRGFEADIQGQITDGLQAIASFSANRYSQPSGQPGSSSNVAGVPNVTASAFLNYTFLQDGPLKGVSIGAGGHGVGGSYVQNANNITQAYHLPGFAVADLYAGYHHDKLDINLKVSNVFNKYYYMPAYNSTFIPIGEGRGFRLVAKYQF